VIGKSQARDAGTEPGRPHSGTRDPLSPAAPLVSVISLAHNRRFYVAELLAALQRQTYPNFEVILVDNASTDGTAAMVRREHPEVKLIESGGNLGMVAYNLGFEAALGEFILVMDDDGLPGSYEWIALVVQRFKANPRLGAVCCTVRMRDTGRLAGDSPQFAAEADGPDGYPGVAFNGTGAGLRAAALNEVGLYPVPFNITFLELHLCTRLLDAAWQVRHFPEIEVWHSRPSGSSMPPLSYHGLRNYYWYVWQLYPWPQVVGETLHHLGSTARLVGRKDLPAGRCLRVTFDALRGAGQSFRGRRPISTQTLRYMRRVRRHGNWHHIAPEVVPFPGRRSPLAGAFDPRAEERPC
jgi:GT2 family glycosyltransferase